MGILSFQSASYNLAFCKVICELYTIYSWKITGRSQVISLKNAHYKRKTTLDIKTIEEA